MEPDPSWQAQTDVLLKSTNITVCGNDYIGLVNEGIRNLFAPPNATNSDPRPLFLAFNGLSNSPSHRQWELLISDFSNGGGARDYSASLLRWRSILDSVQAPRPTLTNAPDISSGAFAFLFPGQRGRTNVVESTSNLVDWVALTNVFGTNAPVTFRDADVLNNDRRFYRLRRP